MIESLEYAVSFLGVPLLVVMGHSSCGAVTEALLSEYPRGLFSHIALPSVSNLHEAIIYNTKESVKTILDRSPLILDSIESGDLSAGLLSSTRSMEVIKSPPCSLICKQGVNAIGEFR